MKSLIIKLFTRLLSHLTDLFKWLSDNLFSWLTPILKALGLGGIGIISLDSFRQGFDDGVNKFGAFARLFKIDSVLNSINNSFASTQIQSVLNTDFLGICSSFGIITAINEILNAMAFAVLVSILLFVTKMFILGTSEIVKMVGLRKI